MAGELEHAAQELLAQPDFAAALGLIESRLAARQGGQPAAEAAKPAMQVTSQEDLEAQVAAEIKEQQRQRQEAVDAYNTAADGIIALLEQSSGSQLVAVPALLLPAVTTLLRFYHADAADAGPAPQLSREVQVLLSPASRAAVAAHLTDLHQRASAKQGPFVAALPPEALGEGVTPGTLPGGRTCRLLAKADGSLVAGLAAAPAAEVPGLPGGPLNLQTLALGLAVAERQVPVLHPLSLLMLDAAGERFVACSVCGHVPCLEHAHMRLVSRQLAVSFCGYLSLLR
jgi:hypothetical protein